MALKVLEKNMFRISTRVALMIYKKICLKNPRLWLEVFGKMVLKKILLFVPISLKNPKKNYRIFFCISTNSLDNQFTFLLLLQLIPTFLQCSYEINFIKSGTKSNKNRVTLPSSSSCRLHLNVSKCIEDYCKILTTVGKQQRQKQKTHH